MLRRCVTLLIIALVLTGSTVYAQVIQSARGELTKAVFDGERPVLILHLDSTGRAISMKSYDYDADSPFPSAITHYRSETDWEKISYSYDSTGLVSVSLHTIAGLKDSVSIARADSLCAAGARAKYKYLPGIPDPAREWRLALQGSRLCAQDPGLSANPLDGKAFLFSTDGRFLCRVDSEYDDATLLIWQGEGIRPYGAQLADPDADTAAIGPWSRVKVIDGEYVAQAMQACGAGAPSQRGLIGGSAYLARNSKYGGVLDFAVQEEYGIRPEVFYVTNTYPEGILAHNHINFGNFLWGASAREAEVPLWLARLGAHFNNYFLSPDSRGTWDSQDDQLSISAGHHWR